MKSSTFELGLSQAALYIYFFLIPPAWLIKCLSGPGMKSTKEKQQHKTKSNHARPHVPSIHKMTTSTRPSIHFVNILSRSFVPKHTWKKSTTRKTQNEEKGHVIRHTHRQLWTTNLRRKTKISSHISFNSAKVPIEAWMMQSTHHEWCNQVNVFVNYSHNIYHFPISTAGTRTTQLMKFPLIVSQMHHFRKQAQIIPKKKNTCVVWNALIK